MHSKRLVPKKQEQYLTNKKHNNVNKV